MKAPFENMQEFARMLNSRARSGGWDFAGAVNGGEKLEDLFSKQAGRHTRPSVIISGSPKPSRIPEQHPDITDVEEVEP